MTDGRIRAIGATRWAIPAALALAAAAGPAGCGGTTLLGAVDGADGSDAGDGSGADADGSGSPPPPADGGLGDVGWRDSTEPWTPPAREPERECRAFDVWSNDAAVYVLMGWEDIDGGPPHDVGQQIMTNDGTGWREFYSARWTDIDSCDSFGCIPGISGMIRGRLVTDSGRLAYVSPAGYELDGDGSIGVDHVFVVNDTLAYATWRSTGARVIRWDGTRWGPIPVLLPYEGARKIWADEDDLFVVGTDGTVVSLEGSEWRIHDAGTLDNVRAVWGFDGDDVWIALSGNGLRHYDGTSWTAVDWPFPVDAAERCADGSIDELWGADGTLFLRTTRRLVRWDGSGFRSLGHWPAATVVDDGVTHCRGGMLTSAVWGNAPDEVFLAIHGNRDEAGRSCPDAYLLYWDGTSFHWF